MAVIQDRKVGVKINFLQVSVQNRHETTRPRYILIKLTYHIETTQIWTSIELNFFGKTKSSLETQALLMLPPHYLYFRCSKGKIEFMVSASWGITAGYPG